MNFSGIFLAINSMLGIWLGHVWVRKGEYYVGKIMWIPSLLLGLLLVGLSLIMKSDLLSGMLALPASIFLYSVHEMFEQEERVKLGHAPKNPKRCYPWESQKV